MTRTTCIDSLSLQKNARSSPYIIPIMIKLCTWKRRLQPGPCAFSRNLSAWDPVRLEFQVCTRRGAVRRKRCSLLTHQDNRCASAKGLQNHVHTCSDGVTPYPLTFAKKKKLGKETKNATASRMHRQRSEKNSSRVPPTASMFRQQQPCSANSSHVPPTAATLHIAVTAEWQM